MSTKLRLNTVAFERWRTNAGVSKTQIENQAGVPRYYWSRWRRGSGITRSVYRRLRDEAGVPSSVFIPLEANRA